MSNLEEKTMLSVILDLGAYGNGKKHKYCRFYIRKRRRWE